MTAELPQRLANNCVAQNAGNQDIEPPAELSEHGQPCSRARLPDEEKDRERDVRSPGTRFEKIAVIDKKDEPEEFSEASSLAVCAVEPMESLKCDTLCSSPERVTTFASIPSCLNTQHQDNVVLMPTTSVIVADSEDRVQNHRRSVNEQQTLNNLVSDTTDAVSVRIAPVGAAVLAEPAVALFSYPVISATPETETSCPGGSSAFPAPAPISASRSQCIETCPSSLGLPVQQPFLSAVSDPVLSDTVLGAQSERRSPECVSPRMPCVSSFSNGTLCCTPQSDSACAQTAAGTTSALAASSSLERSMVPSIVPSSFSKCDSSRSLQMHRLSTSSSSSSSLSPARGTPLMCLGKDDDNHLTRLSSSLLQQLTAAAAAVSYCPDALDEDRAAGSIATLESRRERYPPPPLGKLDDPEVYGINLAIGGELVTSADVSVWEFPDLQKLHELRHRLVMFMRDNHLKQADICRFTGLGAPYLSFMVKDPTISNFSSRRRVEVYSMLSAFFNKIDTQQVTLDEISKLVLLSKATARAANSSRKRRSTVTKLQHNGSPGIINGEDGLGQHHEKQPVIRRRRRGRPRTATEGYEALKDDELHFNDFIPVSSGGRESCCSGDLLMEAAYHACSASHHGDDNPIIRNANLIGQVSEESARRRRRQRSRPPRLSSENNRFTVEEKPKPLLSLPSFTTFPTQDDLRAYTSLVPQKESSDHRETTCRLPSLITSQPAAMSRSLDAQEIKDYSKSEQIPCDLTPSWKTVTPRVSSSTTPTLTVDCQSAPPPHPSLVPHGSFSNSGRVAPACDTNKNAALGRCAFFSSARASGVINAPRRLPRSASISSENRGMSHSTPENAVSQSSCPELSSQKRKFNQLMNGSFTALSQLLGHSYSHENMWDSSVSSSNDAIPSLRRALTPTLLEHTKVGRNKETSHAQIFGALLRNIMHQHSPTKSNKAATVTDAPRHPPVANNSQPSNPTAPLALHSGCNGSREGLTHDAQGCANENIDAHSSAMMSSVLSYTPCGVQEAGLVMENWQQEDEKLQLVESNTAWPPPSSSLVASDPGNVTTEGTGCGPLNAAETVGVCYEENIQPTLGLKTSAPQHVTRHVTVPPSSVDVLRSETADQRSQPCGSRSNKPHQERVLEPLNLSAFLNAFFLNDESPQTTTKTSPADPEKNTCQPLFTSPTSISSDATIHFGAGWWRDVDVSLTKGNPDGSSDAATTSSSTRPSTDDESDEAAIIPLFSPSSGNVCAIRMHWEYKGRYGEDEIIWDMEEPDDSIETFVKTYTDELDLPMASVGEYLLASFLAQLESARSFDVIFQSVCRHLLSRLGDGHPLRHLPGFSRKIVLDCTHEQQNIRLIDIVVWNLANPLDDVKVLLRTLVRDANLPLSFVSVLYPAFIRAIFREKLKFVHECSDLVLHNIRIELGSQKGSTVSVRKRGNSTPSSTMRAVAAAYGAAASRHIPFSAHKVIAKRARRSAVQPTVSNISPVRLTRSSETGHDEVPMIGTQDTGSNGDRERRCCYTMDNDGNGSHEDRQTPHHRTVSCSTITSNSFPGCVHNQHCVGIQHCTCGPTGGACVSEKSVVNVLKPITTGFPDIRPSSVQEFPDGTESIVRQSSSPELLKDVVFSVEKDTTDVARPVAREIREQRPWTTVGHICHSLQTSPSAQRGCQMVPSRIAVGTSAAVTASADDHGETQPLGFCKTAASGVCSQDDPCRSEHPLRELS